MRLLPASAVAVTGAALVALGSPLSEHASATDAATSWQTQTLAPDGYASAPAVAVAGSGRAAIAWGAGVPGIVCHHPPRPPRPPHGVSRAPARCGRAPRTGVFAALSTLPGQFGPRQTLVGIGPGHGAPMVAVSGSGVAYVAWQTGRRSDWVVASAAGDRFSPPGPLGLPANAQLQELASAGNGPVAAVWLQYGVHHAPAYRYALLTAGGHIGRVTTIADVQSPLQDVQFAINDAGAVAASWLNTGQRFGGSRVSAELCSPSGGCGPRHTVRFRTSIGQSSTVTTTLSDAGTATILVSGLGEATTLQATVSRHGHRFPVGRPVVATGERQVSTAVGAGGAAALFNVGQVPVKTIAWSHLTDRGFTRPRILDRLQVGPALAAGDSAGQLMLAWIDAPVGLVTDTSYSIHAAVGTADGLGPAATVIPGREELNGGELAGGIDGRGDALVVWQHFDPSYGGDGVFATVRPGAAAPAVTR